MKVDSNDEASDEPVETAIAALSAGWASLEEIADAVAARRGERPMIGQLMLKRGKLTVQQMFAVLAEEATSDKLFGQIAVEKGFISASGISTLLELQATMCPPLWQMLVSRGVIATSQAESIRATTRDRLRQSLEATLVGCEA
jgi:hypothetical protein